MTEFNKGYWNLEELEIQEWIDPGQRGYMCFDVNTCKEKILEDLNDLLIYTEEAEDDFEQFKLVESTINSAIAIIEKRF